MNLYRKHITARFPYASARNVLIGYPRVLPPPSNKILPSYSMLHPNDPRSFLVLPMLLAFSSRFLPSVIALASVSSGLIVASLIIIITQ